MDSVIHLLGKHGWALLIVALVAIVAIRIGVLDWYADESLIGPDGSRDRIPNTFASIDHPFHISKERAVLDALRHGEFPRWFSNHQAGYPAEFYPLGADLVIVAAWGLGLGLVPIEVVHKLVVIAVLFIPVAAYWTVARRDGWPASVAVIAVVLHLFLPGNWLGGGPDELLRMGMWPNVFAAYLTLPLVLMAVDFLRRGSRPKLVLAAGIGSLAIYANPRATIAVATALLAVGIVALGDYRSTDRANRRSRASHPQRVQATFLERLVTSYDANAVTSLAFRSALLVLAVFLLSASLLVPLRARQDLYEFTRFVEFDSAGKVWEYSSGAIPVEVMAVAAIGAIVAARSGHFYGRVFALWLVLAAFVIVVTGWALRDVPLLAQLEGPRLMPLVRVPALFLAAIGIHWTVRYLLRLATSTDMRRTAEIAALTVVTIVLLTPFSTLSSAERGLPMLETTDEPAFTAIARAAVRYEQVSTASDRPLIIGSPLSDHASFWIPSLANTDAFHAAWVWHWQSPEYADRTRIADISRALDLEFLRRHALTMVLIATTDSENLNVAHASPHLQMVDRGENGGYAIFRVDDAGPSVRGPVALSSGEVTAVSLAREHLRAEIRAPQAAVARIAINDYPAWQATINGRDVSIRRTDDGYMLVDIPAGEVQLELTYVARPVVWIGRLLTIAGIALLTVILVTPRIRRHGSG